MEEGIVLMMISVKGKNSIIAVIVIILINNGMQFYPEQGGPVSQTGI